GVAPYAFTFGLRPALLISELALVAPGLLALAAVRVPLPAGLGLNPIRSRTALFVAAAAGALWVASLGLFEVQYALWSPPPASLAYAPDRCSRRSWLTPSSTRSLSSPLPSRRTRRAGCPSRGLSSDSQCLPPALA